MSTVGGGQVSSGRLHICSHSFTMFYSASLVYLSACCVDRMEVLYVKLHLVLLRMSAAVRVRLT